MAGSTLLGALDHWQQANTVHVMPCSSCSNKLSAMLLLFKARRMIDIHRVTYLAEGVKTVYQLKLSITAKGDHLVHLLQLQCDLTKTCLHKRCINNA